MKYYIVKNDVITVNNLGEATCTDEPLWLRKEIDKWTLGGRPCVVYGNNLESFIISPDSYLHKKCPDESLREISEVDARLIIAHSFPEKTIEHTDGSIEVVTTTFEDVCKVYWKYAQNHSGTISTSETWTLANSPHHITGDTTLAANQVLTIEAGCQVFVDGNYTLILSAGTTGTTEVRSIGTTTSRIVWRSNASLSNLGTYTDWVGVSIQGNNSKITVRYSNFSNSLQTIKSNSAYANGVFDISYCLFDCCQYAFYVASSWAVNVTIANCKFIRTSANATGGTVNFTLTFNDCEWLSKTYLPTAQVGMVMVINDSIIPNVTPTPASAMTVNRCFIAYPNVQLGATQTANLSFTDCLFGYAQSTNLLLVNSGSANTTSFTTCDVVSQDGASSKLVNNSSSSTVAITFTDCLLGRYFTRDRYRYVTSTADSLFTDTFSKITLTNPRTTRKFPFTPTSIVVSDTTQYSSTISWNSGFRSRQMVRFGTSSGNYTGEQCIGYASFSNWNGLGQYTATPSITIPSLKPGTTYYYIVGSFDWLENEWVWSSESSFTTLALPTASITMA